MELHYICIRSSTEKTQNRGAQDETERRHYKIFQHVNHSFAAERFNNKRN